MKTIYFTICLSFMFSAFAADTCTFEPSGLNPILDTRLNARYTRVFKKVHREFPNLRLPGNVGNDFTVEVIGRKFIVSEAQYLNRSSQYDASKELGEDFFTKTHYEIKSKKKEKILKEVLGAISAQCSRLQHQKEVFMASKLGLLVALKKEESEQPNSEAIITKRARLFCKMSGYRDVVKASKDFIW
jgi:hypothetical protein